MKPKIVLASASKRRSRILNECGIPHTIVISNIEEVHLCNKKPSYTALHNACLKAHHVAHKSKLGYVIGADTLVSMGKHIIGKPPTISAAKKLLKSFSHKSLSVYTGLCVIDIKRKKEVKAISHTIVRVKKLSPKIIREITTALDPTDRAGGFSIEGVGSYIFDMIEGSFYNVLGLPTISLYELFQKLGVDLLDYRK